MRKQDAVVFAWCAAVVVTAALYVSELRAPIYYPVEHVWRWQKTPGIAMLWYGRSLFSVAGGVLTLLVLRPVLERTFTKWDAGAPAWAPRAASILALAVMVAALLRTVLHEYSSWMR